VGDDLCLHVGGVLRGIGICKIDAPFRGAVGGSVEGLNSFIGFFRAEVFHNPRCICIVFDLGLALALVNRGSVNSD
jgi:hypothetical protein